MPGLPPPDRSDDTARGHSTDLAAPSGQPSPAVGWIVELQPRKDGIWGRVEWTEEGAKLISSRAYRGISPALQTDKEDNVVRLLRAALTNAPNLPQLVGICEIPPAPKLGLLASQRGTPGSHRAVVPRMTRRLCMISRRRSLPFAKGWA
jgi:hypothetical protein